jgi:hypothetical protein
MGFRWGILALVMVGTVAHAEPSERVRKALARPVWFATQTLGASGSDMQFSIVRVDSSGLAVVHQAVDKRPREFVWLDADRLAVLASEGDTGRGEVRLFERGVPMPVTAFERKDWDLGPGEQALPIWSALNVTKSGEVWVSACVEYAKNAERCVRMLGLRADLVKGVVTAGALPGKTSSAWAQQGLALERMKGKVPKGYWLTLGRTELPDGMMRKGRGVRSIACKGPGEQTTTWPEADSVNWEFRVQPKRFRWLVDVPPLYAVMGDEVSPVAHRREGLMVFRACEREPLDAVRFIAPEVWLEEVHELNADRVIVFTRWVVRALDEVVGEVPGSSQRFAAPWR